MPVSTMQIEDFLREEELVFYRQDNGTSWMVPFQTHYVNIHLRNDGDDVVFHGSPVADLSDMTGEEKLAALGHYMQLNDLIILGRFCGNTIVNFEIAVPIEDGEFTLTQLRRCFYVTSSTTRGERYRPGAADSDSDSDSNDFECEPFASGEDGDSDECESSDSESQEIEPKEEPPSAGDLNKGEQPDL